MTFQRTQSSQRCRKAPRIALVCCGLLLAAWNLGAIAESSSLPISSASSTEGETTTIWDGVYTEEQASRGQVVYDAECGECHLDTLLGDGNAPALAGKTFFVRWDDLAVGDMITVTRATMPQFAANTLSTEEYVDIAAYVLAKSDVPSGETELPTDADALAQILVTPKPE